MSNEQPVKRRGKTPASVLDVLDYEVFVGREGSLNIIGLVMGRAAKRKIERAGFHVTDVIRALALKHASNGEVTP